MFWLAKMASRPFDRVLALSFHVLWLELELLVERFTALLPSTHFGGLRHYGRMAVEAFFIAEAFQWFSTAAVLLSFWLFYAMCLPATEVSYPFVIDWNADVFEATSLGLKDGLNVACKNVLMQPIPAHVSAMEMHLHTEKMGSDLTGLFQLQLLNNSDLDVIPAVWQPLLPTEASWSSWWLVFGLHKSMETLAPLLRQPVEMAEVSDISSARICLQPPPKTLSTSLHVQYKLQGFYRFVQHWPFLWSVVLVCATGFATWSVICVLLVILVLRRRAAANATANQASEVIEDDVSVRAVDIWKQSIGKMEEAKTQVVQAAKDPDLQLTAASAISGAVVVGTGGGCAGLVTGSVAGGVCGLVPAIFTFGLSIPVGVVLGGGAGAAAGTALGSTAGAVLGSFLGRRWVHRTSAVEDAKEL